MIAVYKQKRGGKIFFYVFTHQKFIDALALKQPEIPKHDDEIIGAKPASKGFIRDFADLVRAVRIAAKIYHLLPFFLLPFKFNSPRFVTTRANGI